MRLLARVRRGAAGRVWTPVDFINLGTRAAVDKALQRMARSGDIRRIDRGLYDRPRTNKLTGKPAAPDYAAVLAAISRRDQTRLLVDGITAANQLGLTDAVPGRVAVYTDARIRPIELGRLKIEFKLASPSKLYWAGRPAMRVVQALHWLRDLMGEPDGKLLRKLRGFVDDPVHGEAIRRDLRRGLHTLPAWMRDVVSSTLLASRATRGARRR